MKSFFDHLYCFTLSSIGRKFLGPVSTVDFQNGIWAINFHEAFIFQVWLTSLSIKGL